MINLLQYIQGALLIKDLTVFPDSKCILYITYQEDATAVDQKRGRLWRGIRRIGRHFRLGLKILRLLKKRLKMYVKVAIRVDATR